MVRSLWKISQLDKERESCKIQESSGEDTQITS